MGKEYLKGLIEEILYVWGEPLDISDLCQIIEKASKKEIIEALNDMSLQREKSESGLLLKKFGNTYQLVSRNKHHKYFEKFVENTPKKLSSSALETLSIIAYKQPITRVEIDKIRGVNSQRSIDNLIEKGLVLENGRLDKIGRPIIYITSDLFLRYFDLEDLSQLPKIENQEEINNEN